MSRYTTVSATAPSHCVPGGISSASRRQRGCYSPPVIGSHTTRELELGGRHAECGELSAVILATGIALHAGRAHPLRPCGERRAGCALSEAAGRVRQPAGVTVGGNTARTRATRSGNRAGSCQGGSRLAEERRLADHSGGCHGSGPDIRASPVPGVMAADTAGEQLCETADTKRSSRGSVRLGRADTEPLRPVASGWPPTFAPRARASLAGHSRNRTRPVWIS